MKNLELMTDQIQCAQPLEARGESAQFLDLQRLLVFEKAMPIVAHLFDVFPYISSAADQIGMEGAGTSPYTAT
eukprot:scaffold48272_cov18-Tisochrysis_lutea.AAC.1